jgi:transcription elongation factor
MLETQIPTGKVTPEAEITIVQRIEMMRNEIAQMGGNDSEIPTFNTILEKLSKGEISEVYALRITTDIYDKKMEAGAYVW